MEVYGRNNTLKQTGQISTIAVQCMIIDIQS